MRCTVRPDWIKQAALTIADIKPATSEGSGGPPSLILFDFSLRALVFAECEVWQRGFLGSQLRGASLLAAHLDRCHY